MGLFNFGKKDKKPTHKVYSFKKNGRLYYVVSDGGEEAEQIVAAVYPGYKISKEDLTEGADDKELVEIYTEYPKNIYEISR